MMMIEDALAAIAEILESDTLSKTQEQIVRHIWQGCPYQEIAKKLGYNEGYVRSVGSKLFQKLANALGEKVSKQNIQFVLKRYMKRHYSYARRLPNSFVPSPATALTSISLPSTGLGVANQDWGEAIDVSAFYGRGVELATLQEWIVDDRCRLIGLQGKTGIGKTALSVKLAQRIEQEFDFVVWRSLRYAPSLSDLLAKLIHFFAGGGVSSDSCPETVGDRISYLIDQLKTHRCLIVLNYFQAVLDPSFPTRYRKGFEGYGELIQRIGETHHQSCVVIESTPKPLEVTILQGDTLPVRSLTLAGLDHFACQKILRAKGLKSSQRDFNQLIADCQGNPLELKLAATTIQDSFDGNVVDYLRSLPVKLHA
jgi:DNA-binding CsgD family transcriptional regulator